MLSVPEASARILEHIQTLSPVRVPLLDALGHVLATPIISPLTLPPWDNSAMDGYAVNGDDVVDAAADRPARLTVTETVAAGGFASRGIERGEAVRIMTGAPLPDGADTVIRVEDTDGGLETVVIRDARDTRRNIRFRGEEMRVGDEVLPAGTPLGAAQIGVLASVGHASVDVFRRPRVAIMGSGDELVDLDRFQEALDGKKIVTSNSYTLQALVHSSGGAPVNLGVARDSRESVRERLERARGCDLLLTSAGVSVGEFDYTREVLAELGAEMKFWRVRMRPGAPIGFGLLNGTPWIGLPGNPVSAMVTFELFVRPVLRRMLGHTRLFRRPLPVTVEHPVSIGARLMHFLRAVVTTHEDGRSTARLTGPQGSGILLSMSLANGLLIVPEDRQRVEAGETLNVLPLGEEAMLAETFAV